MTKKIFQEIEIGDYFKWIHILEKYDQNFVPSTV